MSPSTAAGVEVTVARASGTAQPVKATRLRSASSRRRRLPARTPAALRTPVASTVTPDRADHPAPPSMPSAATASVTRFSRCGSERPPRHPHGHRVDVDAVADQPGDDVGVGEGGADRTRIAVAERAHRVEEVGDVAGTGGAPGGELGGRGVGVAERHDDAASDASVAITSRAPGSSGAIVASATPGVAGPAVDQRRRWRRQRRPPGGRPCGPATASGPRGAARAAPHPGPAPARRRRRALAGERRRGT